MNLDAARITPAVDQCCKSEIVPKVSDGCLANGIFRAGKKVIADRGSGEPVRAVIAVALQWFFELGKEAGLLLRCDTMVEVQTKLLCSGVGRKTPCFHTR